MMMAMDDRAVDGDVSEMLRHQLRWHLDSQRQSNGLLALLYKLWCRFPGLQASPPVGLLWVAQLLPSLLDCRQPPARS